MEIILAIIVILLVLLAVSCIKIVPQAHAGATGNRLFLLPVDSGVKTVRIADAAKATRPSVAPDVTDEK